MKKFQHMVCAAAIATALAGCATTKKAGVKVEPDVESIVVDWSGKNLGGEAAPKWLQELNAGNADVFKAQFDVAKSDLVKLSETRTASRETALIAGRVDANARLSETLKSRVKSNAADTLDSEDQKTAFGEAVMAANNDLTGLELVTQFWQKLKSVDKESGDATTEYVCYTVYKISKAAWDKMSKSFISQVVQPGSETPERARMMELIQNTCDEMAGETTF